MNHRARRSLLVAALIAAAAPTAPAQLVPPPQGKNITVEVARGGSVAIPLAGSDRRLRDLQFGIARGPRHGRLSGLSQDGPRKASVRYVHGNDDDSTGDSFVYTVRASSGGTGRATVTIRVVDADPVLAAPAAVDFGDVVLGETPVRSFQLANLGGGVIEGAVSVPQPFQLETPGDFSLRRGRGQDFAVSFAPSKPGEFSHRVRPVPSDPSVIVFSGRALEPFQVRPDSTVLAAAPDDTRTTSVILTNLAATNLVLRVEPSPDAPVELPREVAVPAGGTARVDLLIAATNKAAYPDFAVVFSSPDHSAEWRFSAPGIPARLEIVSPPDFGLVAPGRTAEAALVVRNTGGAPGHLRLHPGTLIRPAGSTEALDIPPGETREIRLKMRLKKDQEPPTSIACEFNGAKSSLPVAAHMEGDEPRAAEPDTAPASAPPPPPDASPSQAPTDAGPDPNVILTRAPGGTPRLEWTVQPGWESCRLHRNGVPFTGYAASSATWWQSLLALPARITGFFGGLVNPGGRPRLPDLDPFAVRPAGAADQGADLVPQEIGAPVVWQLMGRRPGAADEEPAGAKFHIVPQGVAPLPEPGRGPVTRTRGQRVNPGRHEADVVLALPHDPAITGFRFERGHLVVLPDSALLFVPATEGAEITVATQVARSEAGGESFTMLAARLNGLPAGSATAWRAVPLAGETPLPPTDPMLVRTRPAPRFPWTAAWLSLAALLLAGLFYLRWRSNRLPG